MPRPASPTRRLLAGDGFSAFGGWVDFMAILTLAAWQYRLGAFEMAWVSAALLLPGMLFGPALGRLCDRGDARRLLLGSLVLRVACTAGVLASNGLAPFLALVALRSVFAAVAPPAINVLAMRSVEAGALPRFYSLINVVNSAAKVVAPALGTVASSLSSETFTLSVSAACSALAWLSFVSLPASRPLSAADGGPQGAGWVAAPRSLLPLLWTAGSYAFSVFLVNNLVPLVLQRGGFDKSLLGLLVSCSGAGNLVAGLWLARRSRGAAALVGRDAETMVPALQQAIGFAMVALLLWRHPAGTTYALPMMFFAIGTCSARFAIALNVRLSAHHGQAIGAASGALQSTQNAMILLAPLAGAAVLDAAGGAALFAASALSACVLFGLMAAMGAKRWTMTTAG